MPLPSSANSATSGPRVAFFPDSFHEVNGVALTSRQFEAFARRRNLPFLCVRAGDRAQAVTEEGSVWTLELPRGFLSFALEKDLRFDPAFLRHVPLIGEVLERFQPELIHITGPSEIGMLGAGLARHLDVPLAASWHTNVHEYLVRRSEWFLRLLPERPSAATAKKIEDLALATAAFFYSGARVLFAPNPELCTKLSALTGRPCHLMSRGVDAELFNPSKRPSNMPKLETATISSPNNFQPPAFYQGTASEPAEKVENIDVLKGHEFTRANNAKDINTALAAEGCSSGLQPHATHFSESCSAVPPSTGPMALYQGTTSVVPQPGSKSDGASAPAAGAEAILGFVGRLSVEKNIALLVDIENELVRRKEKFRFLIVGHGSDEDWLRAHLHRAEFTGVLRGEELARAYASMDLFVFPSHTDTFGNAVLEAQASGVPAIVTPDGGPKTIVRDGVTGRVVPDEDFAPTIAALLADKEKLASMRVAARGHAEKASWDAVFESIYAAYKSIPTLQEVSPGVPHPSSAWVG
jgi:glycosyltransferase involved in cell wall biosynthesis